MSPKIKVSNIASPNKSLAKISQKLWKDTERKTNIAAEIRAEQSRPS